MTPANIGVFSNWAGVVVTFAADEQGGILAGINYPADKKLTLKQIKADYAYFGIKITHSQAKHIKAGQDKAKWTKENTI